MSIPEWFILAGIPEVCVEKRSSCKENGRSFSIIPEKSDTIWRVSADSCWINKSRKKVDYLFWVKSKSGKRAIILVELKGGSYGKALAQIDSTLQLLCKYSYGNIIHTGPYQKLPGHTPVKDSGIQIYVILSQGHSASERRKSGRKIPQRFSKLEALRRKYRVRVMKKTKRFEVKGVDKLF